MYGSLASGPVRMKRAGADGVRVGGGALLWATARPPPASRAKPTEVWVTTSATTATPHAPAPAIRRPSRGAVRIPAVPSATGATDDTDDREASPTTQPPRMATAGSSHDGLRAPATAKVTAAPAAHDVRASRRRQPHAAVAPTPARSTAPTTPPSARTVRYVSGVSPG